MNYFGAYYTVTNTFNDPTDYRHGQPILYGAPRLHYIKCSADVYYVRLAKDYLEHDKQGEFMCDTTVWIADDEVNVLAFVNGGDMPSFHPVSQMILGLDIEAGIDREDILELRAGIMMQYFLGFVPDHVFMVRPDLVGSVTIETEEGPMEDPIFKPGNWYLIDNPEFL